MLKVGLAGCGNTGGQIATLAQEKIGIDVYAINSSEKDLETIPDSVPTKLIKDKEGLSQGAGKDRKRAQQYLKDSIADIVTDESFINFVKDLDILFIVSSTGGGTGSGISLILSNILQTTYRDVKIISVGVLPVNSEAYGAHVNTLQYLHDLYDVLENPTYLLYDNDKLNGIPSHQILQKVNEEIVKDIDVMRCTYNYTTRFDSIDDRDMMRILSFPGRIMVSRIEDFSEKDCDSVTIEDMIIDNIKRNCHVESQRDKKVMATGIISNLSQVLTDEFDDNLAAVKEFTGDPVHAFKHIYVNDDRKQTNNVFFIMSGLTAVNDKINIISDRIDEIERKQKILEEESALSNLELAAMSEKIADKKTDDGETQVDLMGVFSKFDI